MMGTATAVIDLAGLASLIDLLQADDWTVMGPVLRDGVVGHGRIRSLDDLPTGSGDEQDAGRYRLRDRGDGALFGYAVGPQSWKSLLFPARELLRRSAAGVNGDEPAAEPPSLALLGVRSCDLHAIAALDRVLLGRPAVDQRYAQRRARILIVAVTCSDPAGTCFCASMGTGPDPQEAFDLALTELLDDRQHRFLVRAGSDPGADLLDRLPTAPVSDFDRAAADELVSAAVRRMGRRLDTADLRDLLLASSEHPQWADAAHRCLSCGNCTLACPTCFCTSIEDATDLADGTRERSRVWDSCFTGEFSQLHGGSVRTTTKARYRQWATHKLASWWDQFGTSGCVGCGRCITWCPAAIDITAEVAAIRATSAPAHALASGLREA